MENIERGLETLQVWQRAIDFAVKIQRELLPLLPAEEKWALVHQLRRSLQSIPANIAEGYGRYYYQESIRFCYIARGSLEETYSHLLLTKKLDYIKEDVFIPIKAEIEELRRMINGYIIFLKKSKRGASEPGANFSIHEPREEYQLENGFSPVIPTTEFPDTQSPNT